MSKRAESGRGLWVWAGALLFALLLNSLPESYADVMSSVVRNGLFSPFVWVNSQYRLLHDNLLDRIRAERELAKTRAELEQLREVRMENQRLRTMLEFKQHTDYKLVLAEVIGTGTYRYPSALLIAAGKDKGIVAESPVLTTDGIVGKIKSVGSNSSIVQMLLDPGLRIAARDQRSRVVGIVYTKNGRKLTMDQVPIGESIAEGDRIVSSGLGGIFPKGLLIGYVVSVREPPEGMFKSIEIEPAAQLNRIEEVFVLIQKGDDSTFTDG